MGYEIARLVNEIDDEFLCSICSMVLENAVQSPCEHAFCSDCIHLWLEIKETCPVDACSLALADIKPTPRYFRNILGKIKVKCDFESQGCQTILELEQLQQHLIECVFNANAELICDKGCNIKMTRGEYETANCFTHLAKRQQDHFDSVTSRQREEILKLRNEIDRQREEVTKLNDELTRSAIVIERQRKEITKLRGDDDVATRKWQICENMKILIDPTQILQHGQEGFEAFAQLNSSLESENSSFEIKVLNLGRGGYIVIGLTRKGQSTDTPPGYLDRSVGYCSFGHVVVNGLRKNIGQQWKNDDVVKVGIAFPENVRNDVKTNAEIYFAINGEIMFTEEMKMPDDGFFPTVYMWSNARDGDNAPKGELLNFI